MSGVQHNVSLYGQCILYPSDGVYDYAMRREGRSQYVSRPVVSVPRLISAAATNLTMTTCEVPQDSQAGLSSILAGVLGMLALIMVSLRFIQRAVFSRQVGVDDGLILAALICAVPLNVLMFPCRSRHSSSAVEKVSLICWSG